MNTLLTNVYVGHRTVGVLFFALSPTMIQFLTDLGAAASLTQDVAADLTVSCTSTRIPYDPIQFNRTGSMRQIWSDVPNIADRHYPSVVVADLSLPEHDVLNRVYDGGVSQDGIPIWFRANRHGFIVSWDDPSDALHHETACVPWSALADEPSPGRQTAELPG